MTTLFAVAAGGAFGALGRYLVISWVGRRLGSDFPFGTLTVNVIGSCLLGALFGLSSTVWPLPAAVQAFVMVGLLGAFTTVSTFAMDTAYLAGRRAFAAAAIYVGVSVILSIAGLALGLTLARAVLV